VNAAERESAPRERAGAAADIGFAALVIGATFLAYLPALGGGFIWNDGDYVTKPSLRSLGGLARIWTEAGAAEQYYPLLHSAFWAEHRLWGDSPLGYHVATVLLHAASAVLFALVLRRLFAGAPARARPPPGTEWLAALLFALHPVHVESVAWISEQKNTASLAFYLASALVYLGFDENRRPGTYAGALVLFLCALACKTVTATLPAALLVALWWMRGRLAWRRDFVPLLPWLAMGAAAGLFSGWVERHYGGAQGAEFDISGVARALVAGRAVWLYLGRLAWPSGLNFIYPRWAVDASAWWQWLFPLGAVALGAALWAVRGRSRAPLAAFLFFAGSLFPALGFVNLYGARYSWVWDHWQYLPDLGPIALGAACIAGLWRRLGPLPGALGAGLAAALVGLLGALTWAHCGMFHDDETLYLETIRRNPDSWFAHYNLGLAWSREPGRLDDAIAQYREAARARPDFADAHYNLALALAREPGRDAEAIAEYEAAIRSDPAMVQAHNNLGLLLARAPGRLEEAIGEYRTALRLEPGDADVHVNLGIALARIPGRLEEAIAQYEEALRLNPGSPAAHNDLGLALSRVPGRLEEAIAQYGDALRLDPDFAEAHNNLGVALARTPGRMEGALAEFGEAVRLDPDLADAHDNLGHALSETPGRLADAVAQYEEALRLRPDDARLWHHIGVCWLNLGNLPKAAEAFRQELRLSPDSPAGRQALAAVLQQEAEER
jgi:tetratricopeptide (TPR) repeat protein